MVNGSKPRFENPDLFEIVVRQMAAEQRTRDCDRETIVKLHVPPFGWGKAVAAPIAPSFGAHCSYGDEDVGTLCIDRLSVMTDAVYRLETMIRSRSYSDGELKRLRRAVALVVHPDLHDDPDKRSADELMKKVNMLFAAIPRRG